MLDAGCLSAGQYFGRQRRLPYQMLDFGLGIEELRNLRFEIED
jgi:hypothetical protein